MPEVPVPQVTRDELLEIIKDLQRRAMAPGIPIPQQLALKNRAMELYDQFLELDASEFNNTATDYEDALGQLNKTISDLRTDIRAIDDNIIILGRAASVFKALDGILKIAVKNLPILL